MCTPALSFKVVFGGGGLFVLIFAVSPPLQVCMYVCVIVERLCGVAAEHTCFRD